MAQAPILTPQMMVAFAPMEAPVSTSVSVIFQSEACLIDPG
jgi:hypothetical protein